MSSPSVVSAGVVLRTLAIGFAAGALCVALRTPLPWLIGPLFACALASANGLRVASWMPARAAGHWVIGTALGLFFTSDALARLTQHAGLVAAGTAWALFTGLALAWALRRFAGLDGPTAFFAGAIGGASEMALQGERHGARVDLIAAAHSMRILLVVSLTPFAFQALGVHGSDTSQRVALAFQPWPGFPVLVALTLAGGWLLHRWRSPNPWMIGPLLVAIALSATDHAPSGVPAPIVSAGQVFIGVSLGTRFAPGFLQRAPRVMAVVAVSTLLAILLSAAFAGLLAWVSGVPWATLTLATSPGGIAEMALTAKLLGLGVPVVTLFHLTRVLLLVLLGGTLYRWLAPRMGWRDGDSGATAPAHPLQKDDHD